MTISLLNTHLYSRFIVQEDDHSSFVSINSLEMCTRVQAFSLANFNRTREQFFILVAAIGF